MVTARLARQPAARARPPSFGAGWKSRPAVMAGSVRQVVRPDLPAAATCGRIRRAGARTRTSPRTALTGGAAAGAGASARRPVLKAPRRPAESAAPVREPGATRREPRGAGEGRGRFRCEAGADGDSPDGRRKGRGRNRSRIQAQTYPGGQRALAWDGAWRPTGLGLLGSADWAQDGPGVSPAVARPARPACGWCGVLPGRRTRRSSLAPAW